MELIGSNASPFVRRIRICFPEIDFTSINVFEPSGQDILGKLGSIRRVPILVVGDQTICDSNLIHEYLTKRSPCFKDKCLLNLINEVTDSGLCLLQFKKFGLDPEWKNPLSKNHFERIDQGLKELGRYDWAWDQLGIWLFCTLDWFLYRDIFNWKEHNLNNVDSFYQENLSKNIVQATDPRL